ncbi:MAG TPA: 50S ribosomal protein L10 [Acidimicrobiia bacterium]|nr:50S ribosomal protein L10 [Acidimicrobiia bacterium]
MPRPEKVAAVAEIRERIEGAKAVFLAEYAGLSVKQQQELRRGLREQGAEFKVVKMTLARRAASDLELDEIDELLLGPTGIAFADTDAVSAAKVLKEFSSAHEVFSVKGGLLGMDFLTPERISELAEIAPRGELLAMLAGAMKAPLTAMAGLLAALPRSAATVMQQLLEKKESGEFAPVADPADDSADEPADQAATGDADAASASDEDEAEPASAVADAPAEEETTDSDSAPESDGGAGTDEAEAAAETPAVEEPPAEASDEAPGDDGAADAADDDAADDDTADDDTADEDTDDEDTDEAEASAADSTEESDDDNAAEPAEED